MSYMNQGKRKDQVDFSSTIVMICIILLFVLALGVKFYQFLH